MAATTPPAGLTDVTLPVSEAIGERPPFGAMQRPESEGRMADPRFA